ncbi:EamA family transporter [Virgibacillus halophilus]|uniref:EamA family transporter n=1 Tax=Tigheibacillus halophilus TaxID=361280 RepID=UPI003642C4E7
MSALALSLIVMSAFMHATWNYLAKRSAGGFAFVWLYMSVSTVIFAPFVIGLFFLQSISFGWMELAFIAGSALIHVVYALMLQKGYKIGDFSLVYPVARGIGPAIVAISAVFLFHETLSLISIIGIILIIGSIFVISGGLQAIRGADTLFPLLYGLMIGCLIAAYTLLDKAAVGFALMPPLLLNYGTIVGQVLMLTPKALRNVDQVKSDWKEHRKEAIGIGILNPLAYILVLTAMTFTQVSHVAPVRELSILIGTVMGAKMLSEGLGYRRIVAAATMVLGIIVITLS